MRKGVEEENNFQKKNQFKFEMAETGGSMNWLGLPSASREVPARTAQFQSNKADRAVSLQTAHRGRMTEALALTSSVLLERVLMASEGAEHEPRVWTSHCACERAAHVWMASAVEAPRGAEGALRVFAEWTAQFHHHIQRSPLRI